MAATDSIPPGFEFGGGEEVEKPECVYHARIVMLSLSYSSSLTSSLACTVTICIFAYVHPSVTVLPKNEKQ